jgi:outer membrane protein assembly factor BamB
MGNHGFSFSSGYWVTFRRICFITLITAATRGNPMNVNYFRNWDFPPRRWGGRSPILTNRVYEKNRRNPLVCWHFGAIFSAFAFSAPISPSATTPTPGTNTWEFQTGGSVSSPAIGNDGTVYVGSTDEKPMLIPYGNPDLQQNFVRCPGFHSLSSIRICLSTLP